MGVYNQLDEQILSDAVNSILCQTLPDFEFIIYDDGSCAEAAGLLKRIAATDDRIVLIGHEENKGLAFSLNACIAKAQGKYIARMDADDISYPERFARQVEFLVKNKEYAWCGTGAELFDSSGIWGKRIMPKAPEATDYLKYSPYIHPTVMYRAEIFNTNEGYLTSVDTLRCEDYEIFMRLRESGLRGANLDEALFAYREDESSYAKRTFRHRWNEAKCRYRNFKALNLLWPKGWLFVLRPIVASLIPRKLIAFIKRKESGNKTGSENIVRYENRTSLFNQPESILGEARTVQRYTY